MSESIHEPRDLRSLLRSIIVEARALFSTELQLARSEISENASRAGFGLMLFAIAALVAFVGLTALSVAAVLGVAALGIAYGWAALIVGAGFIVVAAIFALIGKSRLSGASLMPKRTLNQVKADMTAVKEVARA